MTMITNSSSVPMRIENVTFVEAVRLLAERLGLEFRTRGIL